MDIGNQLNDIVATIVEEIKKQVDAELSSTIAHQINVVLSEFDYDTVVATLAAPRIDKKIKDFPVNVDYITSELGKVGTDTIGRVEEIVYKKAGIAIEQYLKEIDVTPLINAELVKYLNAAEFPRASISANAINLNGFVMSGDHIDGGIINNFASAGIDDKATNCQLTITDTVLVSEQPILTSGIQVRGNVKVENTLIANRLSLLDANLESEGIKQIIDFTEQQVLKNIATNGVLAPKLVAGDKTLVDNESLATSILTSNLRRVGTLENLQTRGETLLDGTLYVNKKRVGVNTLEPEYALSVWDGEVEVAINKVNQTRAFVGTHRPINVTLGANGKENISLDIDGSVTINDLRLGALPISTASNLPNWQGRAGEIVFNDSPGIGHPIGWVCLEGHRWAKFGIISD